MRKDDVRQAVVASLEADLAVLVAAAQAAHAAATHEECVADNKYDTLGLEASYIAQGQANRAQEIRVALESYRSLELRPFDETTPIRLTALVSLEEEDGSTRTVFLGPEAGGVKITVDGREVVVITPNSPLGRAILGKRCGDIFSRGTGGRAWECTIVAVD